MLKLEEFTDPCWQKHLYQQNWTINKQVINHSEHFQFKIELKTEITHVRKEERVKTSHSTHSNKLFIAPLKLPWETKQMKKKTENSIPMM